MLIFVIFKNKFKNLSVQSRSYKNGYKPYTTDVTRKGFISVKT